MIEDGIIVNFDKNGFKFVGWVMVKFVKWWVKVVKKVILKWLFFVILVFWIFFVVVLGVVWYLEYEIILGVLGKLECGLFW